LRTFSSNEPEPQAKSNTLSSCFDGPCGRVLAVQRDDGGQDVADALRGVELAGLLAGAGRELADQVLVGVAQRVHIGRKAGQPLCDLLDDLAQHPVLVGVRLAELFGAQIDLRKQAAERALERFVLDVLEALAQGVQQFVALLLGKPRQVRPQVGRLDHVMHLAAHLLLELWHVRRVGLVPRGQRHARVIRRQRRIVRPQLLLRRRLVVVRQIAQEQECQHVIAEIIRVHRAA